MKKGILLTIVVLAVMEVSCSKSGVQSGNLYVPSASDVTANATLAELQQGRQLYINNCGRCHGLPSPDAYPVASWKTIIPNMAPYTSMNSNEVTLVTKYVCRGKQ